MSERVIITKTSYDKSQFTQVVNNQFTQLIVAPTASVAQTIDVNQFFQAYDNLFFQIPKLGETNSHQYLVNKSGNYIDENAISAEVQALLEEITQLRQENLDLQQQVVTLQVEQVSPSTESNAKLSQKGATTKRSPQPSTNITSNSTSTSTTQTSRGGSGNRTNNDKQTITVTK